MEKGPQEVGDNELQSINTRISLEQKLYLPLQDEEKGG